MFFGVLSGFGGVFGLGCYAGMVLGGLLIRRRRAVRAIPRRMDWRGNPGIPV